MKIKITQPGWGGYTGLLGMVEFVDGVSVDDCSRADASHIGGIVSIEDVETGRNPSAAQLIVDSASVKAPVEVVVVPEKAAAPAGVKVYSRAELEAIGDARGIKGIRDVSDLMDVKGNSIPLLIEKILQAQAE